MDLHRCRFIGLPTQPINALAFNHPETSPKPASSPPVRLALARGDGSLEIWNPSGTRWHQELVIPGAEGRSIDGLVWINAPDEKLSDGTTKIWGKSRLFSIGYSASITEWDLEKAKAKSHASGTHGDLWSLEACGDRLIGGTADGALVSYSLDGDALVFERSIVKAPSKKSKIVSLAVKNPRIVIAGCSDSSICAYSLKDGSLVAKMSLGRDKSGHAKNIIVWTTKILPKKKGFVAGDSTGHLTIWNNTYHQVQRIQAHSSDILCLSVKRDGSKIISGSMDRRTAFFDIIPGQNRYSKAFHRKYHALASFEGLEMSVTVSGGLDGTLAVLPLRSSSQQNHRFLSHLPQATHLRSAPKARLLLSWWQNTISIWQLLKPVARLLKQEGHADLQKNHKFLAQMLVKGDSHITCADISADGNLLVVSTVSEIKMFDISLTEAGRLEFKRIVSIPPNQGANKVALSPDTKWLCWIENGDQIRMAKVANHSGTWSISPSSRLRRIQRKTSKHTSLGGLGAYDRNISQLSFSQDSRMLAVADLAGYIDTFTQRSGVSTERKGHGDSDDSDSSDEESQSEHWTRNPAGTLLPKVPNTPVVISFSDKTLSSGTDGDYDLLVVTSSRELLLFRPLQGVLSDWSRRNPASRLPLAFQNTREVVKGAIWNGTRAWIYGASSLFMIDFQHDFPDHDVSESGRGQKHGVKRKRGQDDGAGGQMKKHPLAPLTVKIADAPDGQWTETAIGDAKERTEEGQDEDEDESDPKGELQTLRDTQVKHTVGRDRAAAATFWGTHSYRSILGIVPLCSDEEGGDDKPSLLEVALVERPLWDLDLPPKYLVAGE